MASLAIPSSTISCEGVMSISTSSSPSAWAEYWLERAGSTVYVIWRREGEREGGTDGEGGREEGGRVKQRGRGREGGADR